MLIPLEKITKTLSKWGSHCTNLLHQHFAKPELGFHLCFFHKSLRILPEDTHFQYLTRRLKKMSS